MASLIRKSFDFSMKNIPIPSEDSFFKNFIFRTHDFITRMRWKALFFKRSEEEKKENKTTEDSSSSNEENNTDNENQEIENKYGYRTSRNPPYIKEIADFEKDLWLMVESTQIVNKKSNFQRKLQKEVKEIKRSNTLLIPADKTTNMYKIKTEKYKKLLRDNITSSYKKVDQNTVDEINQEAKEIANKLKIADRVETLNENDAFITLKDHKQNFNNDPKCRLINPTKSDLGKASKIMLQRINEEVRNKTKLHQWRNTSEAINWFNKIENKQEKELIQCDIENFYPTISEKLLDDSLKFAEQFTHISKKEKDTIWHARKTVLISEGETWEKHKGLFDVGMGCGDGAEISELCGLKILADIQSKIPEIEFGLYRDDGLAIMKSSNGQKTEKIRKKLFEIFKNNDLKITVQMRQHKVNFLDVTLNLLENTYKPYKKPGDKIWYIHKESNHPMKIKTEMPKIIEKRLSNI